MDAVSPNDMRAFVVGNGPSLNITPLDKLVGEVTYATNRINLIYPRTSWRPTHYVRAEQMVMPDPEIWRDDLTTHLENPAVEVWCNLWFIKWLDRLGYQGPTGTAHTLRMCSHYQQNFDQEAAPHLWHLPLLCSFGSSVNVAIQLAVTHGANEIYLVGCDMGDMGHFDPDYYAGYDGQLQERRYAHLNTMHAHMVCARSTPVQIFNATVGGELEVYPRVNLEDVLCGNSG